MKTSGILLLACALLATPAVAQLEGLDQESTATMVDLEILTVLLDNGAGKTGFPETNGKLVRLSSIRQQFGELYRSRLPLQDGWDQPFLYWSDGKKYALVSAGPDGRLDEEYDFSSKPEDSGEAMNDRPGTDIVITSDGSILRFPGSDAVQTMNDMRSVAIAMESYAVDNNIYLNEDVGYVPVRMVKEYLEPTYIRTLPEIDVWDNEIYLWTNGQGYLVVSFGADGVPDQSYDRMTDFEGLAVKGPTSVPNDDIIFVDGQFVQWPAGMHR